MLQIDRLFKRLLCGTDRLKLSKTCDKIECHKVLIFFFQLLLLLLLLLLFLIFQLKDFRIRPSDLCIQRPQKSVECTRLSKRLNKPSLKQQILNASKLTEFTQDNFKFDEHGRKVSKWVENTVGKGEIARYEQFLLFPQCFQKTCAADT